MSVEEMQRANPSGFKVNELMYGPGDLVLMHGLCVHAGAEGVLGQASLRMHVYLPSAPMEAGYVRTYPLHAEMKAIAQMLGCNRDI